MQKVVIDMKLTEILRDIIKEELVSGRGLYFYHATSINSIKSIKQNGLRKATNTMEGQGLYGFIDYERALKYGGKQGRSSVFAKFLIDDYSIKELLCLDLELAKKIFGEQEYHLKNQFERYFKNKGGIKYLVNEYNKILKNPISIEEYVEQLNELEKQNRRYISKEVLFDFLANENDNLDVVYEGEYGLQIRINNLNLIQGMVNYYVADMLTGETTKYDITIVDDIPEDKEYDLLRAFFNENPRLQRMKIDEIISLIKSHLFDVRNNLPESEKYNKILDLIKKVKQLG
jgi:hypothetical protein